MTIRVLVNGASGKMGQAAIQAINEDAELDLVGKTSRQDNLADEIKKSKAQVVVDLTNAEVVLKNTQIIIAAGAHPVIGTSGLLEADVQKLQQRCAELKLGGVIAPNFSIGAVLMMKHAQQIAKYFSHVEIIEMHHDGKLDSPSGTSVRTAEMLAVTRQVNSPKANKEVVAGARGAFYQDIHIHSIRLPGLVAHQQIMFGSAGETLSLRHDTIDRQCFMPGIILACKKVVGLDHLVYGLEHIL